MQYQNVTVPSCRVLRCIRSILRNVSCHKGHSWHSNGKLSINAHLLLLALQLTLWGKMYCIFVPRTLIIVNGSHRAYPTFASVIINFNTYCNNSHVPQLCVARHAHGEYSCSHFDGSVRCSYCSSILLNWRSR